MVEEYQLPASISPSRGEFTLMDDRRNRDAIYQANGIPDKVGDLPLHLEAL